MSRVQRSGSRFLSYPTLTGDFFNFAMNPDPRINILFHNSISSMLIKVSQAYEDEFFPFYIQKVKSQFQSDLLSCWIKDVTMF